MSTDIPHLTEPLTIDEIRQRVDSDGMVSGLVSVDLSDLIGADLEAVLDLFSEKLVGSIAGMQIDYKPVHVQESGEIIFKVTVDPSMVLEDAEEIGRRRMFALVSKQGTAIAATALCETCASDEHNQKVAVAVAANETGYPGNDAWNENETFLDSSGNSELVCITCGYTEDPS